MREREGSPYLLLDVLFRGLPARCGADVDGTRLTLAVVWDAIDRLQETDGRMDRRMDRRTGFSAFKSENLSVLYFSFTESFTL